jgi:hypothetical protein
MTKTRRFVGAAAVLVLAVASLAGCAKASTGTFVVRFKNDLGAPAHLYQCLGLAADCLQTTTGARMLPGQTAAGNARANVPNPWVVQRDGGGKVSCIMLKYTSVPETTPLIPLSSAVAGMCNS